MKLHLIPSTYINSTYDIDFQMLYDNGFRGLIFDIDNTLTQHGAPAKSNAIKLFQELDEIGFKYILISNNHEERVAPFAEQVGAEYVADAGKPLAKGYVAAIEKMDIDKEYAIFIGDQMFTDIAGANAASIKSILVRPLSKKEPFHIKLKRMMEAPIKKMYLKNHKMGDYSNLLK